jgi:hypothetical protein
VVTVAASRRRWPLAWRGSFVAPGSWIDWQALSAHDVVVLNPAYWKIRWAAKSDHRA